MKYYFQIYINSNHVEDQKQQVNEKIVETTNMRPKVLQDFCQSTSLHGYSYLTSDSILSKVVWVIIILIATGGGLYFLAINTRDYMKASTVTNIESAFENLQVSNLREQLQNP